MVETRFTRDNTVHVIQIPDVRELIEQDNTDVLVVGPVIGSAGHNSERPDLCKCFPSIDCYYDENGIVDLIIVEHRWDQ